MIRRLALGTAAASLFLLHGAPLRAFDATGTWEGKKTCVQQAGDQKSKVREDTLSVAISQSEDELHMEIDGTRYKGRGHDHSQRPTRGTAGFVRCSNGSNPFSGTTSEVASFAVSAEAAKKSKLSGSSTLQDASGPGQCRYRLVRVSEVDPAVPGCSCLEDGGTEVNGACWFLGDDGNSCDATCGSAGRAYDDATRDLAGSGATNADCEAVQTALGVFSGALVNFQAAGFGCGVQPGPSSFRDTDETTSDRATAGILRICACE